VRVCSLPADSYEVPSYFDLNK